MHYIGDPEHQVADWQFHGLPDNCAVAAQTSIIYQFLPHHDLTMDQADYIAAANGWYHPGAGGTAPDDVGKLFEAFDIPYHRVENASLPQLVNELQDGHRVIVGVHSAELWEQGPLAELWNWIIKAFGLDNSTFNPADHAVCVTGVNVSDPAHPMVVLNDPGDPHGAGHEYPLDRFMDAWKNSDFFYVATDASPLGATGPGLDLGDLLGIGTSFVVAANGVDIPTAMDAGLLVSEICHNVNWDNILAAI